MIPTSVMRRVFPLFMRKINLFYNERSTVVLMLGNKRRIACDMVVDFGTVVLSFFWRIWQEYILQLDFGADMNTQFL